MSSYPIWWDTTVTIYNRSIDPLTQVVTWNSTVISNCFWKNNTSRVVIGDTTIEAENIICRIPKDTRFVEKAVYAQKPSDERVGYFTLSKDDILIKGSVSDIVDEYTKGHRSTDLLNKYRELGQCMQINEFTINTGAGRVDEHYFVRGK